MKRIITEVFNGNTGRNFFAALAFAGISAGTYAQSGNCGDGVTYAISGTAPNQTLTISYTGSGTGVMTNYSSGSTVPWSSYVANLKTLVIESGVTSIGNYAFYDCSGFTGSLTIPNSVISIGNYAFYNCSGFTGSLTIGNSVTSIGDGVFGECSGFTGSLTIGNSVSIIGNKVFYYVAPSIPVYVPCGTSKNYRSVWGYFSNYIEYTDTTSHTAAICRGETYADADFADLMQTGTYYKTWVYIRGCDSIIKLTLTVNPLPEPRISRNGNVLTASAASGYQWYYNNEIIPGATVQSYTCTEDGIYFVEVGNGYGCRARSADINIYLIVGINNYEPQTTNYEVYPNPTTGKLSVVGSQFSETDAKVEIYDVVGCLLQSKIVNLQSKIEIDISHLAAGLYFLKVGNKVIKIVKE